MKENPWPSHNTVPLYVNSREFGYNIFHKLNHTYSFRLGVLCFHTRAERRNPHGWFHPSVRPYELLTNSFAISECVLELNSFPHLVLRLGKEFRRKLSSCLCRNVKIKAGTYSWFISKFRMSYHGITSGRTRPWGLLSLQQKWVPET
jgi:hypothetical protein